MDFQSVDVFKSLILNFCLLVTLVYLLSLTYKNIGDLLETRPRFFRWLLLALMSVLLLYYPAAVGPGIVIDMRAVPIAYVALRKGLLAGLLVVIPVLLYRFYLGGIGASTAVLSALGVVCMASFFGQSVDVFAPKLNWRELWWKQWLIFLPNGFFLPIIKQDPSAYLTVYLPLQIMVNVGFLITLGILRNRFKLLRLVDVYSKQAHQDPLSQLPNRRQFDEDAAALGPTDLLCLVDIDHFKAVNDTYGHAAGDEVLAQLGQLLQTHLRPNDEAYRYGGEEFAVIFRDPASARPVALADRLRRLVESTPFPVMQGKTLTVSVGVARRGEGSVSDCFCHADTALYSAKAAGRNRVVVWSPELEVVAANLQQRDLEK